MNDEPPPRIRPIWLIGGAAAVTVLGICTLISVVAAVALIWFSSQVSSNTFPTAQPVVQNPTQAAVIDASPTPLPLISAPTVIPTIAAVRPAPDQAVRAYYQFVSQKRYDLSWPLLTDAFRQKFNCCAPNYDYAGYLAWWNSVNHVDFGSVQTVSQNGDQAVVYAQLYYVMNTGSRSAIDSDPYIELVFDAPSASWRFNDKRAAP